jgi:hypothetical protein
MFHKPIKCRAGAKQEMIPSSGVQEGSVEGLWALVACSIRKPRELSHRGTLTLQAGRILGGHAHRAYAGTFEVQDQVVTARLETWLWNPLSDKPSLFGVGPEYTDTYLWVGNVDPAFMAGEMTSDAVPGLGLTAALMKICDLSGAY